MPDARPGSRPLPGNMFVPIDLAVPLVDEVRRTGKLTPRARPWLGMFSVESKGRVVVTRVAEGGPAEKAGIVAGDVITAVAGKPVASIADMYRQIWALGRPGVAVPLALSRDGGARRLTVRSGDRYDYLKLDPTF